MAKILILVTSIAVWMTLVSGSAVAEASVEAGKRYYDSRCKVCHNLAGSTHKVGPTLNRFLGKQAGTAEGFNYSTDWKTAGEKGLIWTDDNFIKYLTSGDAFIGSFVGKSKAKTKMFFSPIRNAEDRQSLLLYLKGRKN